MASLEVHRGEAPIGWDAVVCALGGSIFQSTIWAEHERRTSRGEPVFLLVRDTEGSPRVGALAFFQKSRWPVASLVLRELTVTAHPVARPQDHAAVADFVAEVEAWARAAGCARLRFDSFMSGESPFLPGSHGYHELHRVEFVVDLRWDTEHLWQGIKKDQRERIRRLGRSGVTIDARSSLDDLRGLAWVRQTTQAKRSQRGQGYDLQTEETFYAGLYEDLVKQGAGRLFLARRAGEPVAGLFFATFNGRAYSMFSGSSEEGYRMGAQSGLFWAAVEGFKAQGFAELNRGGVPASAERSDDPLHGIYLFKYRLGTTPVVCRSGSKVLNRIKDALARARDRARG